MTVPTGPGATVCVPLVANVPLQPPDAVQLVALLDDHVIVVELPDTTLEAAAVSVGGPGGIKARAAVAWTKPKPELML